MVYGPSWEALPFIIQVEIITAPLVACHVATSLFCNVPLCAHPTQTAWHDDGGPAPHTAVVSSITINASSNGTKLDWSPHRSVPLV